LKRTLLWNIVPGSFSACLEYGCENFGLFENKPRQKIPGKEGEGPVFYRHNKMVKG